MQISSFQTYSDHNFHDIDYYGHLNHDFHYYDHLSYKKSIFLNLNCFGHCSIDHNNPCNDSVNNSLTVEAYVNTVMKNPFVGDLYRYCKYHCHY